MDECRENGWDEHSNDVQMKEDDSSFTTESDEPTIDSIQDVYSEVTDTSSYSSGNSSSEGSLTDPRSSLLQRLRSAKKCIPHNLRLTQELTIGQKKFMENFDPEKSNREKRKRARKKANKAAKKAAEKTLYDGDGLMGDAQVDLCDCLIKECPGCHFPCTKCFSNKCGQECRKKRKWTYEEIQIEGTDVTIQNPYPWASNEPI